MHFGRFSLTPIEQHCTHRADTHQLDIFCGRDPFHLSCYGCLLHEGLYLPDRSVIVRVRLQQVWLALHLHATHVILVIGVVYSVR